MEFTSELPKFPRETWEAIFLNLTQAGDLYNVSLTSHYIYQVVNPMLYRRLYLDPNHYSIYTLSLLRRDPSLCRHVTELTSLPPCLRYIPDDIIQESEALYPALAIPSTSCPPIYNQEVWCPLGMHWDIQRSGTSMDTCTRPLFHFAPIFTNLTSLYVVDDCVPADFLICVFELRNLLTLEVRDSFIASNLQPWLPCSNLPLRELTILRCRTKPYNPENQVAAHLCDAFLSHSPNLISLAVDTFLERAAANTLSKLSSPVTITKFSCSGISQDPDSVLLGHILVLLPAVTILNLYRVPRELTTLLPMDALRNLTNITGQMKSLVLFFGAKRPLQYLTITDMPCTNVGGITWESQLIQFFEIIHYQRTMLNGLAFNISYWSQEVLLCISQLWRNIREIKIQCTEGPGVDQYFQISFGPLFLPKLSQLEVLHIYSKFSQYSCTTRHISKKGVINVVQYPLILSNEEREDILEAPVHYRRWEKICPSFREVAFDREAWWRRVKAEPGGWTFMRDVIPALVQESN